MFGARRTVERHVQPEAPKARGANQHEVRRFTLSRLGEVAKTLLHEVAAGQPREILEPILQGDDQFPADHCGGLAPHSKRVSTEAGR